MDTLQEQTVAKSPAARHSRRRWAAAGTVAAGTVLLAVVLQAGLHLDVTDFLKDLFYLKYLPKLGSQTSLLLVFVFGLMTSVHCLGMCSGIMLTQTVRAGGADGGSPRGSFAPAALYNAGRVLSYTAVGAVVGGVGQVLTLSDTLKGVIPIVGGVFMLVMAVNLLGIFPVLRYLQLGLPNGLVKKIRGAEHKSPLVVGLLTALMPCGPMQMVQIYALGTRSALYGALSMLVFSLGTTPGLLALGTFSSAVSRRFSKVLLRASAVVVAVLGVVMLTRGLALLGVALPSVPARASDGYAQSVVKGETQTVSTSAGESSFPPIEVKKGVKVVWTIRMRAEDYNDCNNEIILPAYHIRQKLQVGENRVEFTPEQTGDFPYTCWMGMIKSTIRVVP